MEKALGLFHRNKQQLYFALLATFIWGLLAHGYGFMQSSFSHDSLNEFCGTVFGNHFKYMTGRFLSPIYRSVFRTPITLPWLIGMLALLWIGLSVFFVGKIFNIESKMVIFLTAGIFTVNITVMTTAATYMHDLDCDMMALLCSIVAVFWWQRYRLGWLVGALFVTASLSFYQAFITVTIVLVLFVCIFNLMEGIAFKCVFRKGMEAIGMLIVGGIIYYLGMKTAMRITGLTMITGQQNTMDRPLEMLSWEPWVYRYLLDQTYIRWYTRLTESVSPFPVVTAYATNILLILTGLGLLVCILSRKMQILEKILCTILVALLPFAMHLMYVLTIESAHEVMIFAIWLTYLLALLVAQRFAEWLKQTVEHFTGLQFLHRCPEMIASFLVLVILYGNVQTANALYVKKDLEQDAYLSMMTRVVYRMEEQDGYIPGETPVVFVGLPSNMNKVIPGFESYTQILGMDSNDVLVWHERDRWMAYFRYILSDPAVFAEEPIWTQIQEDTRVLEMPSYPEKGSIEMLDGNLVVKLS